MRYRSKTRQPYGAISEAEASARLRGTCIHEAGHAVAAYAQGLALGGIRIAPVRSPRTRTREMFGMDPRARGDCVVWAIEAPREPGNHPKWVLDGCARNLVQIYAGAQSSEILHGGVPTAASLDDLLIRPILRVLSRGDARKAPIIAERARGIARDIISRQREAVLAVVTRLEEMAPVSKPRILHGPELCETIEAHFVGEPMALWIPDPSAVDGPTSIPTRRFFDPEEVSFLWRGTPRAS